MSPVLQGVCVFAGFLLLSALGLAAVWHLPADDGDDPGRGDWTPTL